MGRGHHVDTTSWPSHGAQRRLLELLHQVREDNGRKSLRAIAAGMNITSGSRVSLILRGLRPVADKEQLAALVRAMGGGDNEINAAQKMYAQASIEVKSGQGVSNPSSAHPVGHRLEWRRASPPHPDAGLVGPSRAVVRSAYREQVRRIAPTMLRDRKPELAELADFCLTPDGPAYAWWQAMAWAGKSALLAWFVLHPPEGVRVVSFFVTARYSGHSDRVAFVDVVLEQLAELLECPLPTLLTEATREPHMLGMLAEAATVCAARGERLVLVADGLDEDRGVTVGPDTYSIAAMLPDRPSAGIRIVVASRPHPPLPADVPAGHLLRDPSIVRVLDRSPHAEVVKGDAQRELSRLLHGTAVEQDVLGLVTAAGGGLSGADLAALTGRPMWEVEEHLHAVSGRAFAHRRSRYRPDTGPEVYVLGHEEIQHRAATVLGPSRLDGYRQRLHRWADGYWGKGWPVGTPEYLLRGYFQLLRETGDIPGMVGCATDRSRHNRMLDLTGGDTAALAEITTALDALLADHEPDLLATARLAIHRDDLTARNIHIPTGLPAVWASLGYRIRAEALARSITDPERQERALIGLARAVATVGDLDWAEALADTMSPPFSTAKALIAVIEAAGVTGRLDRAEALAQAVIQMTPNHLWHAKAMTALVTATVSAGAPDQTMRLAHHIEVLARSMPYVDWQQQTLHNLVEPMLAAGDLDRAEALACAITDTYLQAKALTRVVAAAMAAGDLDRAEALAHFITDSLEQSLVLASLVEVVATLVDFDRAESLACTMSDDADLMFLKLAVLIRLVQAMAAAGDTERARALANHAIALIDTDPEAHRLDKNTLSDLLEAMKGGDDNWTEARIRTMHASTVLNPAVLIRLVQAMAAAGDTERARALANHAIALVWPWHDSNGWPEWHSPGLAEIVPAGWVKEDVIALMETMSTVGGADKAEALARTSCTEPVDLAQALTGLATAAAVGGDADRALRLANKAEAIGRTTRTPQVEDRQGLIAVATALARAGDTDRPIRLANQAEALDGSTIHLVSRKEESLASVVEALAAAGNVSHAEALTRTIRHPSERKQALTTLVDTVAISGEIDRAVALTHTFTAWSKKAQAEALVVVVKAVATTGNVDRARMLASHTETIARSSVDPGQVVATDENELETSDLADWLGDDLDWLETTEDNPHEKDPPAANSDLLDETIALSVVEAMLASGDIDRAEELTRSINNPQHLAQALVVLVRAVAATGDVDRARMLASHAETLTRSLEATDKFEHRYVLTNLAEAMIAAGEFDRAIPLVHTVVGPNDATGTLANLVTALAITGDVDRAETLAYSVDNSLDQGSILAKLVKAVADAGDVDRAETLANSITYPYWQVQALTTLVKTVAAQDSDRARTVAHKALTVLRAETHPANKEERLIELIKVMGAAGTSDWVDMVASYLSDPNQQARALTTLAKITPSDTQLLLARAFRIGHWSIPLTTLVQLDPAIAARIADELLDLDMGLWVQPGSSWWN